MSAAVPGRRVLLIVAGFTLWAAAFIVIYGANGLGCALGWPDPIHRGVLIGLFLLFTATLAAWALWTYKRWRGTPPASPKPALSLEAMGFGTALAALGSTAASFAPSLFASLCI